MTSQFVLCENSLNDGNSETGGNISKRLTAIFLDFDVLPYKNIHVIYSFSVLNCKSVENILHIFYFDHIGMTSAFYDSEHPKN